MKPAVDGGAQKQTHDATVYPLAMQKGTAPILQELSTFAEMYRCKTAHDIDLAKLNKEADIEWPILNSFSL